MRITEPGIYTMSGEAYHADPCPEPSLSASIAHILCTKSPAHAREAHPRLNPQHEEEDSGAMDIGQAAHAILLEGADIVHVVHTDNWRTNAAKLARDLARKAGKVPLLASKYEAVQAMVAAVRAQLGAFHISLDAGSPENTLVWEEAGVWCRARLDWLYDDQTIILDLKTTSVTANPDVVTRTLFGAGHDIQSAWYLRGLRALGGPSAAELRFIFAETYPPFAISVVSLGPDALVMGEKKCEYALETWRACLSSGKWSGYPQRVCFASMPAYLESAWLEFETRER